jgi:hypothetical protein
MVCSLYTGRGSYYWYTPTAGGKVDKINPTQFGGAMAHLGIEPIPPAYSPEACGCAERAFGTHQGRLVKELAAADITTMTEANRYLREVYRPAFNEEFARPAREPGTAFVPLMGVALEEILCEHFERTVGRDNCVSFETLKLQMPQDRHHMHYVKAKVRVHRYPDQSLAIFHGPRKLAQYDRNGNPVTTVLEAVA